MLPLYQSTALEVYRYPNFEAHAAFWPKLLSSCDEFLWAKVYILAKIAKFWNCFGPNFDKIIWSHTCYRSLLVDFNIIYFLNLQT